MNALMGRLPLSTRHWPSREWSGMAWGLVGVLVFSLSLPFTRRAVLEIDPLVVGLGRAALASLCAAVVLLLSRQALPRRAELGGLLCVALGVVIGFPAVSSMAMQQLPSAHGAMLMALTPLGMAAVAAWRAQERLSRRFWLCSLAACACVIGFAGYMSSLAHAGQALRLSPADGLMLLAVALAALGYAEGGRVSRSLGGWQTICWGLVLALPLLLPLLIWQLQGQAASLRQASAGAVLAVVYLALGSMFLGFFAWYHGLALGGIARVGQLQHLQLFLTLGLSGLLFGEPIPPLVWPLAAVVVALVAVGRAAPTKGWAVAVATPQGEH